MEVKVTGVKILIDECDLDLIRDYSWYLNKNGYIIATINHRLQFLHCVIAERMGLDVSNEVDHEDMNRINNQQNNLRSATHSQNQINSKKQKNNTSGFKGVSWHKATKKWQARIQVRGKKIYLGLFNDPEDAARTYDKAALKHFGEFARLNFPKEK